MKTLSKFRSRRTNAGRSEILGKETNIPNGRCYLHLKTNQMHTAQMLVTHLHDTYVRRVLMTCAHITVDSNTLTARALHPGWCLFTRKALFGLNESQQRLKSIRHLISFRRQRLHPIEERHDQALFNVLHDLQCPINSYVSPYLSLIPCLQQRKYLTYTDLEQPCLPPTYHDLEFQFFFHSNIFPTDNSSPNLQPKTLQTWNFSESYRSFTPNLTKLPLMTKKSLYFSILSPMPIRSM